MKTRKIWALLLALAMMFSLVACAGNNAGNNQGDTANNGANDAGNANDTVEDPPAPFPTERAISLVSYTAAGGGDVAGRVVTANIQTIIDQRMDVVNMTGANSLEAVEFVLNQPHDGYNLLLGDATFINNYLISEVPYTLDDFTPIAKIGKSAPVFFVRADSPFQTLDDVIEACKANPSSVSIAHGRVNSGPHITLRTLENLAGFQSANVPTQGGSEALSFVMGGHVDVGISIPSTISAGIENGDLRALCVSDTKRWDGVLAEVPTMLELGYDVNMSGGFTVYAPSDMPAEDMQMLHDAFVAAMQSESTITMANASKVTLAPDFTMEDAAAEYASFIETMTSYYTLTGELLQR